MGRRPAEAAIHRADIQWPRKPKVSESNDLEIRQLFLRPQTHFFCSDQHVFMSDVKPWATQTSLVSSSQMSGLATMPFLKCSGATDFIGAVEGDLSIVITFWGPSSFHQDAETESESPSKVLINHLNSDRRIVIGKLGQRTGRTPPPPPPRDRQEGIEMWL